MKQNQAKLSFIKRHALLIASLGICFYLGYVSASWQQSERVRQIQVLEQNLATFSQENSALNSQVNEMKIALDVARLSNESLKVSLQEALQEHASTKQQLGFYERIMAPELTQAGFVVEQMEVIKTSLENTFTLKLVLLQKEDTKAHIKGDLNIRLSGSENGKSKVYGLQSLLSELSVDPSAENDSQKDTEAMRFGFKYFQIMELRFTLPEGFSPEVFEIATEVYKYKRKLGDYRKDFTWAEAYSETE